MHLVKGKQSHVGPLLIGLYERYEADEQTAPPYSPASWWERITDRWLF